MVESTDIVIARPVHHGGSEGNVAPDHFITEGDLQYAGRHLHVDLWDAEKLDDPCHVDAILRMAAKATGATILHGHFHHFGPNSGVSGVLILAESHISIHTWPERRFAAIDVFVCGNCDPGLAVSVLRSGFSSRRSRIDLYRRGLPVG